MRAGANAARTSSAIPPIAEPTTLNQNALRKRPRSSPQSSRVTKRKPYFTSASSTVRSKNDWKKLVA